MAEKPSKGKNVMFDGFQDTITLNGKVLKILGKPLPPYEKSGEGLSGVLLVSEDGTKMLCHECGRMFKSVGIHAARVHGVYEEEYKDCHGLFRKDALMAPKTREIIGNPKILELINKNISARKRKSFSRAMVKNGRHVRRGRTKNASRNLFARCDSQIVDAIKREAHKQNVDIAALTSLSPTPVQLVQAAGRWLGSWPQAKARASGKAAEQCNASFRWRTKEDALSGFRAYYARFQTYPNWSDLGRGVLPSSPTIRKLFGTYSLNAIKKELGWPVNPRSRKL